MLWALSLDQSKYSADWERCAPDVYQQLVSCAGDGMIHFTDLDRESTYGQFQFDCHAGTTYEVIHFAICDLSL